MEHYADLLEYVSNAHTESFWAAQRHGHLICSFSLQMMVQLSLMLFLRLARREGLKKNERRSRVLKMLGKVKKKDGDADKKVLGMQRKIHVPMPMLSRAMSLLVLSGR